MDVLIIEDEEALLASLVEGLASVFDRLEVRGVHSVEEAERLLAAAAPRLIVSDVRLPGKDGLQLFLDVRSRTPKTAFIFMSAFPSPEAQDQARRNGIRFLSKPFQFEELLAAVEAVLDENCFSGEVGGIALVDLLQVLNMGARTAAVTLERRGEVGRIYLECGQVVHAEVGDMCGREAFDHLMSWKGGSFGSEPDRAPPRTTIDEPFNGLLLDSFRLMDEAEAIDGEFDVAFGGEGDPFGESLPEAGEERREDDIHQLALRTVPGCLFSACVDLRRGVASAVAPEGGIDGDTVELLSIGCAKLLGAGPLDALDRSLGGGFPEGAEVALDEAIVVSRDMIYVFQRVPGEADHAYVSACDTSASLGTVVAKARVWRRSAVRGGDDASA